MRLWSGTLAVVVLALGIGPVWAEDKMVAEEGAVHVMLLRQKSVRQALHLSDDEATKIHDFCDRQWKKAQEVHRLDGEERERKFKEMGEENERFLDETLKPEQRKRLNQITLQVAGLLCVTHPKVASQLNLTDEQKEKAQQLQKTARQEAHQLMHSTSKEERREKMMELRQTSRKRLMSLLTDEQRAKWKEMAGEPYEGELRFDPPANEK